MNKPTLIILVIAFLFSCSKNKDYYKIYYPNGKLKAIYSIKESVKEGQFTIYYESGMKEQEGYYEKGQIDGILKTFHENGNLESISNWTDGINWGITIVFYPTKELHGYFLLNPNGEIMWRREYEKDSTLKLDEGSGLLTIMPHANYYSGDSLLIDLYFVCPFDAQMSLELFVNSVRRKLEFENSDHDFGSCHYQFKDIVKDTGKYSLTFILTQKNSNGIVNEFQSNTTVNVYK